MDTFFIIHFYKKIPLHSYSLLRVALLPFSFLGRGCACLNLFQPFPLICLKLIAQPWRSVFYKNLLILVLNKQHFVLTPVNHAEAALVSISGEQHKRFCYVLLLYHCLSREHFLSRSFAPVRTWNINHFVERNFPCLYNDNVMVLLLMVWSPRGEDIDVTAS